MVKVVLRQEALEDIETISAYISALDPDAADRVVLRIHGAIFKTIATLPNVGRLNRFTGARELAVPGIPYLVIFVPSEVQVDVIAVLHTSRNPKSKREP